MKSLLAAVSAAALLAAAAPAAKPLPPRPQNMAHEIFYQIFTRSMRDSNGDRQGDLTGIRESLPYLQRLGVTSILLTPLYPSSFYHNYFASSFEGVDPEFGTMADFRALVAAVHARGMKIYLDEEFQYVAYDHPWFTGTFRHPGKNPGFLIYHGPGNTDPESGPFGLTMAARFPSGETGITTLDMTKPGFEQWAQKYLLSWVDPNHDGDFSDGVDGFRLDHMMDDLDDKPINKGLFDAFWKPLFARVRSVNPRIRFIAEQSGWGYAPEYLKPGLADAVFAFPLAGAIRSFDKAKIADAIRKTAAATPPGKYQLVFVENHDMNRIASDPGVTPEKLRTAISLSILLKGVPLLYYGEELGMKGKVRPEYKSDAKDIGDREAFRWSADDEAPGEAIWYKGPKSYWTQRFNRSHDGVSVAEEQDDPASLLNHSRRLIALRRAHPALEDGDQNILPSPDGLLVVERTLGKERLRIVSNLTDRPVRYPAARDLIGEAQSQGGALLLKPYETALISE